MSFLSRLTPKQQNIGALTIFAVLILAFYGNTLANGFVLDDGFFIANNPQLRSWSGLAQAFFSCPTEDPERGCQGSVRYYRPIPSISNFLLYRISSDFWIFHFANLLYFFGAGTALFFFLRRLSGDFFVAFVSVLLFLVHPLAGEAVNWPSAATELLLFIFILIALLAYVGWRQSGKLPFLYSFSLSFVLALLTKESALLILPLLIAGLEALFFKTAQRALIALVKNYSFLLAIGIPAAIYLVLRASVVGILSGIAERGAIVKGIDFSLGSRIYGSFTLFAYSLKEMFLPYPSLLFHDVPVMGSVSDTAFLLSMAAIAIFGAAFAVFLIRRKSLHAFALTWIFAFFTPALAFFYVAGHNIFAERFLLGSSAGFVFLAALFLRKLWSKRRILGISVNGTYATVGIISLLVGASWLAVFPQNANWENTEALLRANITRTPNAWHLREYLADDLRQNGDREGAKKEYEEILVRNPDYRDIDHIYSNLAEYARQDGELAAAETYYQKAIEASGGTNYKAYNNFGAFYIEEKSYLNAVAYLCNAFFIDPQAPEPQANMGRIATIIARDEENAAQTLYDDMMKEAPFAKSTEEILRYEKRVCAKDSCVFHFSAQSEAVGSVLPFLILGKSQADILRPENPAFNPQTGEVTLEVPSIYEKKEVTFLFPACGGTYYSVEVRR